MILFVSLSAADAGGAASLPLRGSGRFSAPPDFVVELAAAEPQIRFPMFACLDDAGQLYVAESSGLDLYAEISAGTRKCQVRRLEDRDGDGRYESAIVFADKLVFPMGVAWRDGKLYVADPPDLVTVEDTNGDGRADKRAVILTGFGARDNGSLHGLIFGPDGWLYMTLGQPDGYRLVLPGGKVLEGRSGALIRCRPDGSDPEVLARGFENLVEVIFMPGGEIIGTDNWYQKPRGGIRDALVHLVPGGLYPIQPDSHTKYPITGEPLPALSLFPAVALSGLTRCEGGAFPAEYHGNLFSAQHNTRKVGRHVLRREGATFASEDGDFLTSEDPDFHPSDVLEDRDGTLLVLDTGSWYTQHCPTGRIRKSPATGGIYRVRYSGKRGPKNTNETAKTLWRTAAGDKNAVRRALGSADVELVCAAARIAGLSQPGEHTAELVALLGSTNPPAQLAAAEALARCGNTSAIPALVRCLEGAPDRFLEHASVYALHYLADENVLLHLLDHQSPRVQKGALILLSQPPRREGALSAEMVLQRLHSEDADLRRAALGLLQSRREWTSEALRVACRWLDEESPPAGLKTVLSAFFGSPGIQAEVRERLASGSASRRVFLLEVMAGNPAPENRAEWVPTLWEAMRDTSAEVRMWGARVAGNWTMRQLEGELERLSEEASQPAEVRNAALRASIGWQPELSENEFEFLVGQLRQESLGAGELLRRAHLSDEQMLRALRAAKGKAVVPPASLLVGFRKATRPGTTKALLDEVAALPPPGWDEREYAEFVERLPSEFRARAAELRSRFQPDRESQRQRLAKYEPLLRGGDAERGRAVFTSSKVQCATCHAVAEQGGKIGPDLTRVGAIRSGPDLLESILFPSSTLAQGYAPYVLETQEGEEHSGVIVEEDERRIVLRTSSGAELTLPRSGVKELRRGALSIMPEGLETAMSEQEFRDLLAYLQSLK